MSPRHTPAHRGHRTRLLGAACLLAASTLVLSACGGSKVGSAETGDAEPAPAA